MEAVVVYSSHLSGEAKGIRINLIKHSQYSYGVMHLRPKKCEAMLTSTRPQSSVFDGTYFEISLLF
jgi:hypothetical protein